MIASGRQLESRTTRVIEPDSFGSIAGAAEGLLPELSSASADSVDEAG
jgi:TctA family transporter